MMQCGCYRALLVWYPVQSGRVPVFAVLGMN